MRSLSVIAVLLCLSCQPPTAERPAKTDPHLGPNDIAKLVSGAEHSCALVNGGRVLCWGAIGSQQLGLDANGKPIQTTTPVYIHGIEDAVDVAAGSRHTCAIRENGGVTCWGDDGWCDTRRRRST